MKMSSEERQSRTAVTVIVPVFNGESTIRQCLESVFASTFKDFDVIVVDDGSTDSTCEIASEFPCKVLHKAGNSGPASARNLGARATQSEIIYFLDADVLMKPDTLGASVQALEDRPEVCAVFGSYEKETLPDNFVSVYKNLLHHYTHQTSNFEATAFCGGFSAIRRDVFLESGGFDPEREFLEDIELGYRLRREGRRIWLRPDLQLTHCKRYTLVSLIRSDVFGRAIPWTRLMLESRMYASDLNTRTHHVLSVPVSFLLLASLAFPALWLTLTLPLLAVLVALNWRFLNFVRRERGLGFALRAAVMCWVGYLYSGIGAGIGALGHAWQSCGDAIPWFAKSKARIKDPSDYVS